jgi:trk system potassium uptake protein TrkA
VAYIKDISARRQPNEVITIVVPQFVPRKRWHNLLHAQTAITLRLALLFERGIVITSVPYQVGEGGGLANVRDRCRLRPRRRGARSAPHRRDHDVTVIDQVGSSFSHLDPAWRGRTIEAEAMAEGVLERAGVRQAQGLAAVTNSDAVNAVVAHVARTVFEVPAVVSRNYDPRWRALHEAMGLPMVSSTAWGAQRVQELLESGRLRPVLSAGNGEVEVYELAVPDLWRGRTLNELVAGRRVRAGQPDARRARIAARGQRAARGGRRAAGGRQPRRRGAAPAEAVRRGGLTMYVLIAGGGRTGATLAQTLHAQKHEVRLLEHRQQVLNHIHRELPTELIYEGNATDPRTLELAGVSRCQVLVASMANDAENLSLCFIARERFRVPRTIATINDPRNAWLFDAKFRVDVALNQADVLASLIEQQMSLGDMLTLLKLRRGSHSLVSETLPNGRARRGHDDPRAAAAAQLRHLRDPARLRGGDPARRRADRGRRRGAGARRRGLGAPSSPSSSARREAPARRGRPAV